MEDWREVEIDAEMPLLAWVRCLGRDHHDTKIQCQRQTDNIAGRLWTYQSNLTKRAITTTTRRFDHICKMNPHRRQQTNDLMVRMVTCIAKICVIASRLNLSKRMTKREKNWRAESECDKVLTLWGWQTSACSPANAIGQCGVVMSMVVSPLNSRTNNETGL